MDLDPATQRSSKVSESTPMNRIYSIAILIGFCWVAWATNCQALQAQTGKPVQIPGWSPAEVDKTQVPEPSQLPNEVRHQIGLAPLESQPPVPDDQDDLIAGPKDGAVEVPSTFTSRRSVEAELETTSDGAHDDLDALSEMLAEQGERLTSPEGLGASIKFAAVLAVLSLAPAIILMTTSYVRLIVVFTLLRQAFGNQQLPPTQVLTALSLFLTLLVMAPVWNQVKQDAIDPYTSEGNPISWEEALDRGGHPVKKFMARQIEATGNTQSIQMFYDYLEAQQQLEGSTQGDTSFALEERDYDTADQLPESPEQVPLNILLPAFIISELKVAFLLGFQIYLPFLVLDLVVSSVTVSSGMLMLPPTMVSFPLKLILFVMVDGWNLVVGMLLQSIVPFG